jgi:hypothetical protein
MMTRTRRSTLSFLSSFVLPEIADAQPAGNYIVEVDEESLDCISRIGWRHLATFLHVPRVAGMRDSVEVVRVDPAGLDAALLKDCGLGIQRSNCLSWR